MNKNTNFIYNFTQKYKYYVLTIRPTTTRKEINIHLFIPILVGFCHNSNQLVKIVIDYHLTYYFRNIIKNLK
jgi:hypothetical protein